ncbi:MAG TPA: T9SS type A sorting domain-containing protein [Flavisolibacter sp.]|nr:T9SS type A sorting domain-containing protein [Flavisolibacter sp.]
MRKISLSIPEPCHEDWSKMTPCDKGKFCAACQKTVVDFTNMSDRQIAEHFKKTSGSVCGRIMGDQLNRDIEVPRKRIPWIKYFFQFALPAFLISLKTRAQQAEVAYKGDTVIVMPPPTPPQKNGSAVGKPISDTRAIVKGKKKAKATGASARSRMKSIDDQGRMMKDFDFKPQEIKTTDEFQITARPANELRCYVGGLVMTTIRTSRGLPLIQRPIDTSVSKFAVYPNPVKSGGSFSIDVKKLGKGDYVMVVVTSNGATVQSSDVSIVSSKQVLYNSLPSVAAGNYYVRLTNKRTGASYSNKIIVQ